MAYLVPPVAVLFLVGSLWRRSGPGAALAILIGGHGLSVTLFVLSQTSLLRLHFTLVAGLIFGVSLLILALAGFWGRPFASAPQSVWTAALARPDESQPWWQDYRTQAFVLLLMTAALVWTFR